MVNNLTYLLIKQAIFTPPQATTETTLFQQKGGCKKAYSAVNREKRANLWQLIHREQRKGQIKPLTA